MQKQTETRKGDALQLEIADVVPIILAFITHNAPA